MRLELCCACQEPTGNAGRGEDSLYICGCGPFCQECYDSVGTRTEEFRESLIANTEWVAQYYNTPTEEGAMTTEGLMQAYTERIAVPAPDGGVHYTVWFTVNQQSFCITPDPRDNYEEAEWLRLALAKALKVLVDEQSS